MNNEIKINRLKELQSIKPLVIDQTPCVVGFEKEENHIKVLLNDDEFAIVQLSELLSFDKSASMYFRDVFYYNRGINEILESYIAERAGDYKIEKEA